MYELLVSAENMAEGFVDEVVQHHTEQYMGSHLVDVRAQAVQEVVDVC